MNIPVLKTSTVDSIVSDIVATAARPLEQAITIPREAYLDEEYFRFEAKMILETGWMCLAHISQLKEPGSFVAIDLLDEPLLIVRDRNGTIRALSRACAHRAMDIMPDGFNFPREGKASVLLCPYHHWTYNLDGTVRGCPEMGRAECFDKKDWRLGEFRSETWKGFIFVNLDGHAPPLVEQYADFAKFVQAWPTEDMEIVMSMSWDCEFNWKIMVENWMESYHHLGAHRDTLHPSMPGEKTWTEPEHPYFYRSHLPFTEELAGKVKSASEGHGTMPGFRTLPRTNFADRTEWGLYVGYPCFMFLTMSDRVLWYRLQPISAGRCKLVTMELVHRDNLADPGFAATVETETEALREFHVQDMVINTAVQRGLKSRKVVRGRLSHLEEPVWLLYRYVAARLQGRYPAKAVRGPFYGPFAAAAR